MDWKREEDITDLNGKRVEEAFYEYDGHDFRIVLMVDGKRHILEAHATGYGGECSVSHEVEE